MKFKDFLLEGEVYGKAKWESLITAMGAIKIKDNYPDVLAYDDTGKQIGWYDSTDGVGYINAPDATSAGDANTTFFNNKSTHYSGYLKVPTNVPSLKNCPETITGMFDCSDNPNLITLVHGPKKVLSIYCNDNRNLTSLEGCPNEVQQQFWCCNTAVTSLKGIHHHLKSCMEFYCYNYGIGLKSHVLGLMKVNKLKKVQFTIDNDQALVKVQQIINKHLINNDNGSNLEACHDELCEAGFEDYAQL